MFICGGCLEATSSDAETRPEDGMAEHEAAQVEAAIQKLEHGLLWFEGKFLAIGGDFTWLSFLLGESGNWWDWEAKKHLSRARLRAAVGDEEGALTSIRLAVVSCGWYDEDTLRGEPLFIDVRTGAHSTEFEAVLGQVRANCDLAWSTSVAKGAAFFLVLLGGMVSVAVALSSHSV